jgi:hypothetical protein
LLKEVCALDNVRSEFLAMRAIVCCEKEGDVIILLLAEDILRGVLNDWSLFVGRVLVESNEFSEEVDSPILNGGSVPGGEWIVIRADFFGRGSHREW